MNSYFLYFFLPSVKWRNWMRYGFSNSPQRISGNAMLEFWNGGVLRCCSVKRHQVRGVYYKLREKASVSLRLFLPFLWIDSIKSMEASFFFFPPIMHCMQNFPDQGSNPCPLQRKLRFLTSGSPGKSHSSFLVPPSLSLLLPGILNSLSVWADDSKLPSLTHSPQLKTPRSKSFLDTSTQLPPTL